MAVGITTDKETVRVPQQRRHCPAWCTTAHGVHAGEEDWVHLGEPATIGPGERTQLCMTVDPVTGTSDGPYVLVGPTEYTPAQAAALGRALLALAEMAGAINPRAEA